MSLKTKNPWWPENEKKSKLLNTPEILASYHLVSTLIFYF